MYIVVGDSFVSEDGMDMLSEKLHIREGFFCRAEDLEDGCCWNRGGGGI